MSVLRAIPQGTLDITVFFILTRAIGKNKVPDFQIAIMILLYYSRYRRISVAEFQRRNPSGEMRQEIKSRQRRENFALLFNSAASDIALYLIFYWPFLRKLPFSKNRKINFLVSKRMRRQTNAPRLCGFKRPCDGSQGAFKKKNVPLLLPRVFNRNVR